MSYNTILTNENKSCQLTTKNVNYEVSSSIALKKVSQKLKQWIEHRDLSNSLDYLEELGVHGENGLTAIAYLQNQEVA